MKIHHLITNLGGGGAEKLLVNFLPEYKKNNVDIELVKLTDKGDVPAFVESLETQHVKINTLQPGSNSFMKISYIKDIIRYVNNGDIDVLHVHLFPTMYYAAIASLFFKKKTKMVFTEHSVNNTRNNIIWLRPLERFIYRQYAAIITISKSVKEKTQNWSNHKRVVQIENAINLSKIQAEIPFTIAELKTQFNLEASDKIILMVARLKPPKDHLTVAKSLQYLPSNYHVFYAGEGDYTTIIEWAKAHQLESQIHVLGFRNDIAKLMKSASVNVLSTNYEGLSGVTLEALASNKPFLGSDVPGVQDAVPDQRFLFEKGNDHQLADKILQIMNDESLQKELSETAKHFIANFDQQIMIDKYIALYRNL